jgi:polar amino acid transport system substrate-binding protein
MNLVNLTADAIRRDAIGTRAVYQNGRHPYKDRNDPSLYVFVYDTSVTVIANAAYPDLPEQISPKTGCIRKEISR